MAKKKDTVGRDTRVAFDGPKVEHDALIDQIEARAREQHARSSDASESASRVSLFIEQTGLNSKAYSWLAAITNMLAKKDGQAKAMDCIRSLELALPMVKSHVEGQGTQEMELGTNEDGEDAPEVEATVEEIVDDGEPERVAKNVTPLNFGGKAGAK